MKTVDDALRVIEEFGEIQEMAAEVASDMLSLELSHPIGVDPEEITVEDGNLHANVEEYYGCGDYQTYNRIIPLEYLFDAEWKEKAKAELARKHAEKQEKKRLAAEKAKRDKEDRERRQYLELKAKIEGGK